MYKLQKEKFFFSDSTGYETQTILIDIKQHTFVKNMLLHKNPFLTGYEIK